MTRQLETVFEPAELALPQSHVAYDPVFDEYCLAGGPAQSGVLVCFCPWCGADLPESKRSRWFAELRRLGQHPDDPGLDARFRSDEWWATTTNNEPAEVER